jgi:hypothetical protein
MADADIFDLIDPAELTGYARAALADRAENQRLLSAWLPHEFVDDINYRLNKGGGGLARSAKFRAYDAEPKFGKREGFSRVMGELPPIGEQYVLDEYSNLRIRNGADEIIRSLLLNDASRIAASVDTRFEFARADALVSGSVTIAEDGVEATVEYGRDSSMEVAPGTLWSDLTTSTPIENIQSWMGAYSDLNGQLPGAILMSTRVRNYLLRNEEVGGLAFPNSLAANRPGQVTSTILNQVLSDFELPPITVWDAKAIDTNGISRRFIPDDKVLFLPAPGGENPMGSTTWGTTLEAQEPDYGIESAADHPGLVVATFKQKKTPIRVYTIGAAIGLPLLANPDLAMVADVA